MESYAKSVVSFLGVRAREARERAAETLHDLVDVVTARARASAAEKREEAIAVAFAAEREARLIAERRARKPRLLYEELERTRAQRDEAQRMAAERLVELTRARELFDRERKALELSAAANTRLCKELHEAKERAAEDMLAIAEAVGCFYEADGCANKPAPVDALVESIREMREQRDEAAGRIGELERELLLARRCAS